MIKKSVARKVYDLLSPGERKRGLLLLLMMIAMALMETAGVVSVIPFLAVAAEPEMVTKKPLLSHLFETLGFDHPKSFVLVLGCAFLLFFFLATVIRAAATHFMFSFAHHRNHTIGCRLLAGYMDQPYEFFLNCNTTDLGKNIIVEVGQVTFRIIKSCMMLVSHGLVTLALIGLVIVVDPFVAVVTGLVLGGAYLSVYLFSRNRLIHLGKGLQQANKARFLIAAEALGGIKDVKLLGREKNYLDRFSEPSLIYARNSVMQDTTEILPRFVMEAVAFTAVMATAIYLLYVKESLAGSLSVLGVYVLAGYRLMPSLQQVFQSLVSIRFGLPVLDSLYHEYMQLHTRTSSVQHQRIVPMRKMALQQVTYTYPGSRRPALFGINMEIPAGSTLGIVGSTGAGKTTLVDVLLGLLLPEEGRIVVDETEVTSQNLRQWQNTLGYVPQHIYLADDSIFANIAFGLPQNEIDRDRVIKAVQAAMLDKFVENKLPKGYDTVVGERGVRLSGGQRQRVGIARALYHGPDVLVLDEATSALDNLTEQEVMEAVDQLRGKITVIMVAHRLSTVRNCDRIVLLENGQVMSTGTFQELLHSNDQFRAMAGQA